MIIKMKTILIALTSSILLLGNGFAESIIQNDKFTMPLTPWKVISLKDTPATEKNATGGTLTITAAGASDKPYARQLAQEVAIDLGKTYSLSFDVKGTLEDEKEMIVVITVAPGKYVLFRKVTIGEEWQTQKLRIQPKEMEVADDAKPTLKFMLGKLKGDVSFRNVSLTAAD